MEKECTVNDQEANGLSWDFVAETSDDDLDDEHKQNDSTDRQPENDNATKLPQYNARKPAWWLRLSRRPTKAQKRTILTMQEYKIQKPSYGSWIDWNVVFPTRQDRAEAAPIWYEIGCGNGDNLLALTHLYPGRFYVGSEVHASGAGALLQHMQQGLEDSNKLYNDYTLYPSSAEENKNAATTSVTDDAADDNNKTMPLYSNLRVLIGNGINFLNQLPPASLDAILITFPDPFPKPEDTQWRVFQLQTVQWMRRSLPVGGRLYLATDHQGMNEWAQGIILRRQSSDHCFRRVEPCPDRRLWLPVMSKYEQKGLREGRQTMLSCWEAI
jgi:tRNA G46 methylase TrmB